MKKLIPFATLALSSLFLFGCGQDNVNYTGCWLGEENMAFEVLTENGTDYTIRNINGDLKARHGLQENFQGRIRPHRSYPAESRRNVILKDYFPSRVSLTSWSRAYSPGAPLHTPLM